MAESIAIHFQAVPWPAVAAVLDTIAQRTAPDTWVYPTTVAPYVSIYEYAAILQEYEPADLHRLLICLGAQPASTLGIELGRSFGNQSCDAASELTQQLLIRFTGVADDLYSDCWTLEEIIGAVDKATGGFLDCYRHD